MEIRQLKYFQKLAETLNFSEASRELFITQSTLSQQILNLERYCLAMPAKGLQARNAFDKVISHTDHHYKIKVEINTVGLLFKLVSQTKFVTVLSESTVIDEPGLKAIPIDVPAGNMEGCIHTLKNGYLKASAKEFIHLLGQSTAILKNSTLKGM